MNEREILFRAKRLDSGEWVEGFYLNLGGCHNIVYADDAMHFGYRSHKVDQLTVCQYTGLKDNHNKMIFEGDIIEQYFYDLAEMKGVTLIGVVKYEDSKYYLKVKDNRKYRLFGDFIIKGNIFDNDDPELWEVTMND